jgi:molybdopterin-binding protein
MPLLIATRSNLPGTVKKITKGDPDSEVTVTLKTGDDVTGKINTLIMEKDKIEVGKKAIVWTLAADVTLGKDKSKLTGNILSGTVSRMTPAPYNTQVELKLADGYPLAAEISNELATKLAIKVGDKLFASFQLANSVVDAKRPANAWAGLAG